MNIYLAKSAFIFRTNSRRASGRTFIFFVMIFMFSPNKLTPAQTRSWCVPFSSSPSLFSRTFLMTYYKAKLKSNADKASPCLRPFWIGNTADYCLPIPTLLYAWSKHILISLTGFICRPVPNSERMNPTFCHTTKANFTRYQLTCFSAMESDFTSWITIKQNDDHLTVPPKGNR
jgi:hypothetical protein